MDQAISFLAEPNTVWFKCVNFTLNTHVKNIFQAKYIEFNPLKTTDVKLPEGAAFVIANCCVEMNKAATDHFNIRVAECRLATQVKSELTPGNPVSLPHNFSGTG
jgi:N-acetylgalactosamine kinase